MPDRRTHKTEPSRKEMKFKISAKAPVISDDDERIIEGWASTDDLDRYNEIVDPKAFKKYLKTYLKNPILFFGHEWWALPIGKVLKAEIRDKGLWIQAKISETQDAVWGLIKEKILKTLSIGYKLWKWNKDEETDITTLTELELLEISVVSIPANPEAMIELAKSKGIDISKFKHLAPAATGERKEGNMDPEEIQKMIDATVSSHTEAFAKRFLNVDDAKQAFSEIKVEIGKAATPAELQTLQERVFEEFKAATKAISDDLHKQMEQKWVTGSKITHDASSLGQAQRLGLLDGLKNARGIPQPEAFKSLLIAEDVEKATALMGMKDRKELLQELQDASDDLMILASYFGMIEDDKRGGVKWMAHPGSGEKPLKTYQRYRGLLTEFAKALDTETAGEGAEWLPTYMSATLLRSLDIDRGVIKRIPRVPMPGKTWAWPLLTSRPVAYKKSEAIADNNVNTIILSTAGTGKITFSAKGLGVGHVASGEELEDSIVAILPLLREDFRFALIDGEENAVINGDDSSTHQDTDTAAGSAALVQKLFKGLRYDALNTSGASYDTTETTKGTAAFEYGDLIRTMEKNGKYAVTPGQGFWIVSLAAYFKMLAFEQFTGQAAFGLRAVSQTGFLNDALGHDIVPSEHMRQDLDATGVNGASGNTYTAIMFAHPKGWTIGDRRIYTIESDRLILSDQIVMVATERIDLQKMVPSTDKPTSIGYKITT